MKKYQFLLLILLITGTYSCKKDKDFEEKLPEYPLIYESYSISGGEIKVYTNEGEIGSPGLESDIIQRYKNNLTDLESIEIDRKAVASYLAEDTVKLTIDKEEEEEERLVYENNGIIYWEKQDTSGIPVLSAFYVADILTYRPLYYEEFEVPKVTGYNKVVRYKHCFYVKRKNEGFEIPMFDYLHRTEFGQHTTLGINNRFNQNYLSVMGDNDTIVIQEFSIEMRKKSDDDNF